jgi:hypothetical protein
MKKKKFQVELFFLELLVSIMGRKGKKSASQGTLEYEKIWDSLKKSDSTSVFHEHYSKYRHFKRLSINLWGCLQQIG